MKTAVLILILFSFHVNLFSQGWVRKTVDTQSDLRSVYFPSEDVGYTVGQFGVIFKTSDSGESWVEQTSGVGTSLNSVFFTDDSTGYAVGDVGVILKTIDGGDNWIPQVSNTTENLRAVQFLSGSLGYIGKTVSGSDRAAVLKTINGGGEWIKLNNGIFSDFYTIYFTSALVGYGGGTTPVGGSTYLLKTISGDSVWTNQESNMSGLLPTDTGYAAGGFDSAVRTTNGGTDWTVMTPPITGTYNSLFFTSNNTGYIAGQFGLGSLPLIMKTTDAGDTG